LSTRYHVTTPVNWPPGEDFVVQPFISDQEAERMFGSERRFRKVLSCLRYGLDPSLRCLRACGAGESDDRSPSTLKRSPMS